MPWIQVKVQTTGSRASQVEDQLLGLGAVSVTLEDSRDQPLLEPPPGATPIWDDTTVSGLFEADVDTDLICAALRSELGADVPLRVEALEDKDWIREWMDSFEPIPFGQRLWVCPSWRTPPDPDAVNMLLDPGLAFGTGTHETTALCLRWLDSADLAGKTVVDYGCGSGILAIAAALLGARQVYCVDNDPQALTATRDNAERNQVADRLQVFAPGALPPLQAEVLLANILAGPLISLAPTLAGLVRPQGHLVLSGILVDQAAAVSERYQTLFDMEPPVTDGDWVRLAGVKLG
ncbi:MAG: 50S ribosomal protein L11 methyltransferase [Pseudomonadota bacterium]|nr:50S ribosomal protein L11 methyltransferase [Pseudomonadales bacterium]MDY6919420.1 50S ribosomal protein L11 methyltransferase [Pseudomonadota bacterium]